MNNQTVTIIISVFSMLIIIGFSLKIYLNYTQFTNLTEGTSFPPWPSKCPDYWEVIDGGGVSKCQNTNKIGICQIGSDKIMDFNDEVFQSDKGNLLKCSWSKKCGSPWEGVDNIC